jgi:hypothetical protein
MTEDQIREAGAQAVADFPPLPDEVAAKVGALLTDLTTEEDRDDQRAA